MDILDIKRKPILIGKSTSALNSISVIVQYPDLVSAAILNTRLFNVLYCRKAGIGIRGLEDIGNKNVPNKQSPLENMQGSYQYLLALFTTSDQDDLVRYSNSCKMVTTLQYIYRKLEGNSAIYL